MERDAYEEGVREGRFSGSALVPLVRICAELRACVGGGEWGRCSRLVGGGDRPGAGVRAPHRACGHATAGMLPLRTTSELAWTGSSQAVGASPRLRRRRRRRRRTQTKWAPHSATPSNAQSSQSLNALYANAFCCFCVILDLKEQQSLLMGLCKLLRWLQMKLYELKMLAQERATSCGYKLQIV